MTWIFQNNCFREFHTSSNPQIRHHQCCNTANGVRKKAWISIIIFPSAPKPAASSRNVIEGQTPSAGSPYVWYHNGSPFFSLLLGNEHIHQLLRPEHSKRLQRLNRLDNIFDMIRQSLISKRYTQLQKFTTTTTTTFFPLLLQSKHLRTRHRIPRELSPNIEYALGLTEQYAKPNTVQVHNQDFSPWNLVNKSANAQSYLREVCNCAAKAVCRRRHHHHQARRSTRAPHPSNRTPTSTFQSAQIQRLPQAEQLPGINCSIVIPVRVTIKSINLSPCSPLNTDWPTSFYVFPTIPPFAHSAHIPSWSSEYFRFPPRILPPEYSRDGCFVPAEGLAIGGVEFVALCARYNCGRIFGLRGTRRVCILGRGISDPRGGVCRL